MEFFKTTTIVFCTTLALWCPAFAGPKVRDYDWTITLEAQELTGLFNYKASTLKDPVKVKVTYLKAGDDPNNATPYEDFWYAPNGKPYGQDKHHTFDIPSGEQIAVRITTKDKNPQAKDFIAAANAAVRVYSDVYVHKGMISVIITPDDQFDTVINALQNLNFAPVPEFQAETSISQKPVLLVASDSNTNKQYLEYTQ